MVRKLLFTLQTRLKHQKKT